MKKNFLTIFLIFSTGLIFSQTGSLSPYSFFGIGENTFKGTMDSRSMGGLNVYSDSIHINLTNPAAYTELKLVNYSVGVDYTSSNLKTDITTDKVKTGSINYLAVTIPTKKIVFGFGILPSSTVGYLIQTSDDSKIPNKTDRFEGEGGVNTAFLTFGFKVFKKIRLGISTNYQFGTLKHSNSRFLDGIELYTKLESNSSLSGLKFIYSTLYREKISKDLTLHATYIFTPSSSLSSINSQILSTIPTSGTFGGDTENIDLASVNLEKTKITIPSTNSFGIGIGKELKWFVGIDYSVTSSGGFENKLFNLEDVQYKQGSKISLGGLFIPDYNSFTSFFSRIVYRAGIRIEKTGLNIQNQSINEFGINVGFGLPVQGFQNLNLGFEVGKRGTTNKGLVQEDFFSVRLGVTLNDQWFVKNKYN